MSLTNMQLSKKDAKAEFSVSEDKEGPRFPHGLTLHLNDDVLKKLGFSELPSVGMKVIVIGTGVISSASENRRQKGIDRDVSIQIQQLEIGPLKKKATSAVDAVSEAIKDV